MGKIRQFHIISCAVYTLLCLVWRGLAGHVLSWDHLHYHIYIAHAWWENHLPEELFAASVQSYLNPLPHLPFYVAYQTGAHSLLIALSMAFLHSINLWLLHFIACRLIPPADRMARLTVVCSVLLGAFSPGFQFEVGTSYTDVIVSIPALGAMLLLLVWCEQQGNSKPDWALLYVAGLLAGVSVGLKPSSIVFCATLALALALLSGRQVWSVSWRAGLAGTVGFALSGGAHAWMLWKAFGNPVFPLFNGFFKSEWFPQVNLVSERFRPTTLEAALRFPIDMADSFKRVSFEGMVVDIRPIWLLALAACLIGVTIARHSDTRQTNKPHSDSHKLFWISLILFIPPWIYSSGNIRYAVQSLLLIGPAIGLLAIALVGKRHVWALLAILLPLTGQAVLASTLNTHNMTAFNWRSWTKQWFELSIPAPWNETPAYYLTLQSQSQASLAPIFPPASRFLNLIGQNTLAPDSMVIRNMEDYRLAKGLPLRTLFSARANPEQQDIPQLARDLQNASLSEYGYQIKNNDCFFILKKHDESKTPTEKIVDNSLLEPPAPQDVLISCAVEKAPPLSAIEIARRQKADARIERWAQKCPQLFYPTGFWSVQAPNTRRRLFPATELQLIELETKQLVARDQVKNNALIFLEDEKGAPLLTNCPQRPST